MWFKMKTIFTSLSQKYTKTSKHHFTEKQNFVKTEVIPRVTVAKQLKVLVIKEESSELASLSAFFPWLVTLDRDQRGNVSACKVVEKSSRSPVSSLED